MTDKARSGRFETAVVGASAIQLRRLVSIADERPQNTEAVVPRLADPADLAGLLDEIAPAGASGGDRLVGAVIDPTTPLEALRTVRRQARELAGRAEGVAQRGAAELLYHAAVAAAFARQGANIASSPIEARWAFYQRLAVLLGPGALGDIFRELDREIERDGQ